MSTTDAAELRRALLDPFPADKVGWKPQTVSGNRALAVGYIDARDVMDRLDAVVGVAGWRDAYQEHADGTVTCKLELKLDGEWIPKVDVGGESEQKDPGDRKKAAYSDALKRAAVKWGVGRYLYSLPTVWADYDATKKQFVSPPRLPAWALPGGSGSPGVAPPSDPRAQAQERTQAAQQERYGPGSQARAAGDAANVTPPAPQAAQAEQPARSQPAAVEASSIEKLHAYDADLARCGLCHPFDLIKHVTAALRPVHGADTRAWDAQAWAGAREAAKAFVAGKRDPLNDTIWRLLECKGHTPDELAAKLGAPKGTRPEQLTHEQASRAVALLTPLPDRMAAKKGA